MTPKTFARGRLRTGFLISPAMFAQLCQPPYANRIGTSAVNTRCSDAPRKTTAADGSKWLAGADPCPNASASSTTMPPTLADIRMLFVHFPAFTPMTFTAVSVSSASAAATRIPTEPSGANERSTYDANKIDTAASEPPLIMKRSAIPYRNPTTGW